jgi:DNA polymerase III alpha subunit
MATELEQIESLLAEFRRPCPDTPEYQDRLAEEFAIIIQQRFTDYFLKIRRVLDLNSDIPHMTRGSAGSSLVCYLMAITDVDPIEWNIPLARFLNPFRDDLPDVDIDVPHHQQELAMQRIFDAWPGKTARISNYVMYKERSARREAAKRLGARGRLPRDIDYAKLGVDPEEASRIEKKLMGKKRCLSKHCGGIIVFDRKLPQSLFRADNLILLDKNEVEDLEHLKVDILANRGLSQLMEIDATRMIHEYPRTDDRTADLLQRGDVLGVTQGESPAMRRLFRAIRPTSVADCVFATALVRPVAVEGRKKASFFHDWTRTSVQESAIVCEDDAIERIMKLISVNAYEADMYRRAFAKRNEEKVMEFMARLGDHPQREQIRQEMQSLAGFGLCRAHAVNLGRLIWALAYQKAHNPREFWRAALKHCQGSYARWVYRNEAKRAGWDLRDLGFTNWITEDPVESFVEHGAWNSPGFLPGMGVRNLYLDRYEFAGIVANSRVFKRDRKRYIHFITLGVGEGEYVDLIVDNPVKYGSGSVIVGQGELQSRDGSQFLQVIKSNVKSVSIDSYLNRVSAV